MNADQTKTMTRADMISGVVFVGLAVFLYSVNWQTSFAPILGDPGSKLLPTIIAVAMGALGVVQFAQSLNAMRKNQPGGGDIQPASSASRRHTRRDARLVWTGILTLVWLSLYVLVLPYLGFSISTFIFFSAAAWTLGRRTWKAACLYVVAALGFTAAIHYGLTLGLNILLPSASWSF